MAEFEFMALLWHILLPVLLIAIVAFGTRRWVRVIAAVYLAFYPLAWIYVTLRDGFDSTRIWGAGIIMAWALACVALRHVLGGHDDRPAANGQDGHAPLRGTGAPSETVMTDEVPCAECGYDLRGLGGDTIRCPECGHENERRNSQLSAEELGAGLAISFWSRAVMPAVLLLVAAFLAVFVRHVSPERWRTVLASVSAVLLLIWFGSLGHSFYSSGWRPKWLQVVVYAHLCVVLTPLGACVFTLAVCGIILDPHDWIGWALAGGSAMATLVGAWGYGRLRYNLALHDRAGTIR